MQAWQVSGLYFRFTRVETETRRFNRWYSPRRVVRHVHRGEAPAVVREGEARDARAHGVELEQLVAARRRELRDAVKALGGGGGGVVRGVWQRDDFRGGWEQEVLGQAVPAEVLILLGVCVIGTGGGGRGRREGVRRGGGGGGRREERWSGEERRAPLLGWCRLKRSRHAPGASGPRGLVVVGP